MLMRRTGYLLIALSSSSPLAAADLEQRVQVLERQVKTLSTLVLRMESLQHEVQQLRGEVELQDNAVTALKKRQRDLYLDIDQRLGQAVAEGAPQDTAVEQGRTAGQVAVPSDTSPRVAEIGQGIAPVGVAAAAAVSAKEERSYQKAFGLLSQRRYDEARAAFKKFLQHHPTGGYAGNAQYWLGEASYVTRDFEQARNEFEKVLSKYPASPKVAGALLKIGYIQFNQRQPEQARATLDKLLARYPNSSAARLAQQFIRNKKL